MGLGPDYSPGQTPLDEEEKLGLRISSIASKAELNELEQQNIEETLQWLQGKRFAIENVLNETFLLTLHKRMFGKVWTWAGKFRTSQKNMGLHHSQIRPALKQVCDDALVWQEHSVYPPEEMALRFKHRLVSIHCFANGNGRHSRLMADILIHQVFQHPLFTWGLSLADKARAEYLLAMKAADRNSFEALLRFARS